MLHSSLALLFACWVMLLRPLVLRFFGVCDEKAKATRKRKRRESESDEQEATEALEVATFRLRKYWQCTSNSRQRRAKRATMEEFFVQQRHFSPRTLSPLPPPHFELPPAAPPRWTPPHPQRASWASVRPGPSPPCPIPFCLPPCPLFAPTYVGTWRPTTLLCPRNCGSFPPPTGRSSLRTRKAITRERET